MKMLKPGDTCPCCGQPIKTKIPEVLLVLSWIEEQRRFPTVSEIQELAVQEIKPSQEVPPC